MILTYLSEGLRMLRRRLRILFKGTKKYSGDADKIAEDIISECYDGAKGYFLVSSSGHFCEFYARDFGWCSEALLSLGYKREVLNSLNSVLRIYERHGRVEQTIDPKGKAFTFPEEESPDALAFLIRSLRLAKAKGLILRHKTFLNKEIKRYYESVVEKGTGLVRQDKIFSSMKDYAVRRSSCYDNVMTGMLADDLKVLKILDNPFKKYDYKRLLIDNFWTGEYFLDDLSGSRRVCGDANVLPFWSGLITDKAMLNKAVKSMIKEGLDKPFPLKYTSKRFREQKTIPLEFFAGDYERDTIWPHIGLMYIKIVSQIDKQLAKHYLELYKEQIEKHKNFLEIYDEHGKPFKNLLYYADEGMLWAVNYLFLRKKLG